MSIERKDSLSCCDIEIASVLLASGYKLLKVNKETPSKSVFYFEKRPETEKEIDDFYSGGLKINALAFSNARKNLKSIIYSNRNIS